jgi:hypothetical protein
MAYARWSSFCDPAVCPNCPSSDVYIYDGEHGITCCGCYLRHDVAEDGDWVYTVFDTGEEMQAHLERHIAAGHHVPVRFRDGGFARMWNLYNGKETPT